MNECVNPRHCRNRHMPHVIPVPGGDDSGRDVLSKQNTTLIVLRDDLERDRLQLPSDGLAHMGRPPCAAI